jgi:molybdate transport repressor ModE-like protein
MSEVNSMIRENLDENGRLPCAAAYKISAKTKTPIGEVGKLASKLDIRISACGLGQFGSLEKGAYSKEALKRLEVFATEERKITCKEARSCAGGIGLKTIRGTLEAKNIDVVFCELGCFKEKKRARFYIKTKIWMENERKELLFGQGKTEILSEIARTGSIAQAAENLGMNYKKAWSHIKLLQKNLDDVLVETHPGGGERSGTTLTPLAQEYIEKYSQLTQEIEAFSNQRFKELFLKPRNKRESKKTCQSGI